jgi:hypothetical protein
MAKSSNAFSASAMILALTIVTFLVMTTLTVIPILQITFAYDAKDQATSQSSTCGNGQSPTDVGCQNIDSLLQGDTNTVNIIG